MPDPQHTTEPAYDIADEYRPEPPPPPEIPAWMDGSIRIGIHTSIAGDLNGALESAHKLGCNALQIFSTSPRMWPRASGARISEPDAARFRARRKELGLGPLVVHGNYLVNLASPDLVTRTRSIQAFREELVRALALGADFLAIHPGSSLGANVATAILAIARGLRQATRGLRMGSLRILLENTSGMGSAVGWRFEELAAILHAAGDLSLGICLDTAHTLEAGYDIRSAEGLERTLEAADRTVGLDGIHVVHVNDSKTPLGSRVDRHEHVGRGKIGMEAFRRILTHPLLSAARVPGRAFILETPIDRPGDDRRNVRRLWQLVGQKPPQIPRGASGFTMHRRREPPKGGATRKRSRHRGKKKPSQRKHSR